jgi:serine/threonine protein kinase
MATKKILTDAESPPWALKKTESLNTDEPGVGSRIGQFILHERLSEPGSSPVYRAFNEEIGREEALKFIAADIDEETKNRYRHELTLLGSLEIPGIIPVYRCGTDPDETGREWTYFSMPLVKGKTLDRHIHSDHYSVSDKLRLLEKIADIISRLHEQDILHKDLKPANVMVTNLAEVKILDLGIARLLEEKENPNDYHGTPAFSSPEQLRSGEQLTKATDVYSFAVMSYLILTGRHPFLDDLNSNYQTVKEKCLKGNYPPLELFLPELQGQVSDMLNNALALEPRLRPSISAIHSILKELTTPAPTLNVSILIGDDCHAERAIADKILRNFKVYYGLGLNVQTTYGFNEDADIIVLVMWNNKVPVDEIFENSPDCLKFCLFKSDKDPLNPRAENIRKAPIATKLLENDFAIIDFKDLAELERSLFRFLRRTIKTYYPDTRRVPQRSWEGSPYIGLKTFEYKHSPVFFGRTFAISRCLDFIRLQRSVDCNAILIHGSSGCGKSSLVRAGILPILTEYTLYGNNVLWDYSIIEFNTKKITWQEQLRQAMVDKLGALPENSIPVINEHEILTWCKASADSNGLPSKQSGLILFFDQLETFFSNENEALQRRLFDDFVQTASRLQNIILIFTLRSDFLPSLDSIPQTRDALRSHGMFQLFPPNEYELNEIIRYPAIAAGLTFEDDPATGTGLEQSLCREAINSPEGLPLLEFLLTELYDGVGKEGIITWEKYNLLGGLAGALSRRAELTLKELPSECRKALPLVILKLMSYTSERHLIRNWMPLDEAYDNILYRQIIDHFVHNRLFTVSRRNENSVVSVSHEALIRSWPRVTELAKIHEDFLVFKSNLETPQKIWEKALPSEKKDLLLTGPLLKEGSSLMSRFPDFFTRREKEFLQESMLEKGKSDHARNRQRLFYARTVAIISLLTVIIAAVFTFVIIKQQERENQNLLELKDLKRERDQLYSDIHIRQEELNKLKEQRSLIDMANRISLANQQLNQLSFRLQKG